MGKSYSDTKTRATIYIGNIAFSALTGIANKTVGTAIKTGLSNPYGAVFYGVVDVIGRLSDKVKNSMFVRMVKIGGAVYYTGSTVADCFSMANGNLNAAASFPFDASMAYQLGKDVFEHYKEQNNDITEDISSLFGKAKERVSKIKSGLEKRINSKKL